MTIPVIHQEPPPVRIDADGVIRVGMGRLTLAAVVEALNGELPPAEIAMHFGQRLPDVLAAMAYYYRHQAELRPFLDQQAAEAAKLLTEIEANQPPFATRPELEERQNHRHVETGK